MPAIKLFGRRWLAASDDLVFPCLFEAVWRVIFLTFMSISLQRYWVFFANDVVINDIANESLDQNSTENETTCHANDVMIIKAYLIGVNGFLALNLPLLLLMIYHSARGSITDVKARSFVAPLLYLKIFLVLPETALNVIGTLWIFCGYFACLNSADSFANTIVEFDVVFYWIVFCLIILSFIVAYDPLGAKKYRKVRDGNDNLNEHSEIMFKKVAKLWLKRFKITFCCIANDEFGDEAFTQSAELFSHLFQGTDLVPSDMLAGSILLRVRQKKEQREFHRNQMLNEAGPRYSSDLTRLFSTCPPWMTLRNAQHFLRFAVSSYGWPMVCAITPCIGCFGMMKRVTCCACIRRKSPRVIEDNCCNCNLAGTRYSSRVHNDDVIYASFRNQVFEIPFCILADHSTKSVVLTIRGSWSVADVFTDLSAIPRPFNAPGLPEDSVAHHGMSICAERILAKLLNDNLLEKALNQYPEYDFVITGHSLGAGLSILIGIKLRPKYPALRVFAFATPSGLLSLEAAKFTEQFAFTLVVGDDFAARMTLEAIESLKIGILETLQSCKLPKYRVIFNGFKYAVLGIPSKDLEKPWYNVSELTQQSNHSSTLLDPQIISTISQQLAGFLRFQEPRRKLHIAGRVLHIVRKKKTELDKSATATTSNYEMRWATPLDFTELRVMPRMMLDHFPQNVMKVLTTIMNERKCDSILSVDKI